MTIMDVNFENKGTVPLSRTAVIEIMLTGNLVQERLSDALKPYNLSIAQFNVLRILRGQKGKPASLSCIHEKMIHKMSNTTRLVDKLIEKEFVERVICESNRRKVEITITPAGQKILLELDKVVSSTEDALMENLDKEEIQLLISLLGKINN